MQENYSEIRNRISQKIKDLLENVLKSNNIITNENFRVLSKDIIDFIGWKHDKKIELLINNVIIYQHRTKISKIEDIKEKKEEIEERFKNFFNSHFVVDLKKVELDLKENNNHSTITKYLSLNNDNRQDVRNGSYYQNTMIPQNIPKVRWPNKGDKSLVLAQLLAVKESLETNDIFSVNGPPGTGKTTLLKDVIANIIFNKAEKLITLNSPDQLFTNQSFTFSADRYTYKGWTLNEDFLDFITVVASSNNEAVKNITEGLPLSLDPKWNIDYFNHESKEIYENKEAMGLFSAALGNSTNRNNFFNKFWRSEIYDKDNNKVKVPSFKNTLQNSDCTFEEWERAKNNLQNKIMEYKNLISELTELNSLLSKEIDIKSESDKLALAYNETQVIVDNNKNKTTLANNNAANLANLIESQKALIELEFRNKPNILQILIALLRWKFPLDNWQNNIDNLKIQLSLYIKEYNNIIKDAANLNSSKCDLEKKLSLIKNDVETLSKKHKLNMSLKEKYLNIFQTEGLDLPDLNYWKQDESILQSLSPWLYSSLQNIRAELFFLSNELIKRTLIYNKAKLTQNLNIINMMMLYRRLPNDMQKYAVHIWNSFCFVVPVISTTFSSFSSLFKDLTSKQISYLLIDEAGQTSPHRALGALWRTKRAVVIGDPLQIEPVEILPEEVGKKIMQINNIDEKYNPLNSTAQSFADHSNAIGTYMTNNDRKSWVGFPLRVHRRCDNPMFKIANQIFYDNLMIHQTKNKKSALQSLFPKSLWIEINDVYANQKWVKEEGEIALEIINSLIKVQGTLPSLFIISPFKNVARNMQYLLQKSMIASQRISNQEKTIWLKKSIGTIHTFQGKEAEMIIIILGCDENSKGAVNWASSKPNILNVALTRAKNLVFIIGSSKVWGKKNYFDTLYQNIPSTNCNDFKKKYGIT